MESTYEYNKTKVPVSFSKGRVGNYIKETLIINYTYQISGEETN